MGAKPQGNEKKNSLLEIVAIILGALEVLFAFGSFLSQIPPFSRESYLLAFEVSYKKVKNPSQYLRSIHNPQNWRLLYESSLSKDKQKTELNSPYIVKYEIKNIGFKTIYSDDYIDPIQIKLDSPDIKFVDVYLLVDRHNSFTQNILNFSDSSVSIQPNELYPQKDTTCAIQIA